MELPIFETIVILFVLLMLAANTGVLLAMKYEDLDAHRQGEAGMLDSKRMMLAFFLLGFLLQIIVYIAERYERKNGL